MKRLYALFLLVTILSTHFNLAAQNKYPDGYLKVYLRGSFTEWQAREDYMFQRDGDSYTLRLTELNAIPANSTFKIGDSEWKLCDYGGYSKNIYIDAADAEPDMVLKHIGENLRNNDDWYGTISFTYPSDLNSSLIVTFQGSDSKKPLTFPTGSLPVMYINVYTDASHTTLNNEIIDKDLSHKNYFSDAEYWLDTMGCEWLEALGAENVGSEKSPLPLEIKARGNWTRIGFSKKPFKLKLGKKQNLLGLTPDKSKHYALLAHADDNKGYMRNYTMFNLGHRMGLPWTPWQQPVEVFINGDYRGLYFLTESIRVGDGRVLIEELNDNEEEQGLISGGYIVELDNYEESNQIRMPEKTFVGGHRMDELRITFDTPEEYSDLQKRFVTEQFAAMNDAIGSNSDDTWKYLDLDDAARYYLVNEIISHIESYHGSTYLFRDRGEGQKWHFSPLWDGGQAFNGNTSNFFYNEDPYGNTWIPSMRANAKFNDKVKATWLWFMSNEFEGLYDDLQDYAECIATAAKADHKRWDNAPVPGGGSAVQDNSDIAKRLNTVGNHLRSKIEWLKGTLGDYTTTTYTEPERDDTEAAPLPEYAISGIELPWADDIEGVSEYYDLRGYRVATPESGKIYIVIKGNKAYKALY